MCLCKLVLCWAMLISHSWLHKEAPRCSFLTITTCMVFKFLIFLVVLYLQVKCHSVIYATGATARRLNLPREEEFWSRGISACAICDGASPLFKGQVLAVVGGGDTATEEALYLTKYARHVHLLVRKDQLRASRAMQDRLAKILLNFHFLHLSISYAGPYCLLLIAYI